MEILSNLSPAAILLIQKAENVEYKDLLKYTLLSLLIKKVLRMNEVEYQPHPNNPVRVVRHITQGINYSTYEAAPHELPFTAVFKDHPDSQLPLSQLIKVSFEKAGNEGSYVFKKLCSNPIVKESINQGFFHRILIRVRHTQKGLINKDKVNKALQELEKQLPNLLKEDAKKAEELIKKTNGNIVLLTNLDSELLQTVDNELFKNLSNDKHMDSSGCTGCFIYFGDFDDTFDSAYDASGVDFSSGGCSGDSGCSGCSGCGGCGGCS